MKNITITGVSANTNNERAHLLELIGLASSGYGVKCGIKQSTCGLEIEITGRDGASVNRANSFLYNELLNANRLDNLD